MECKVRCHEDGTITYYSIYTHTWYERARIIKNKEYLSQHRTERDRLKKHFDKHNWEFNVYFDSWFLDPDNSK